VAKEPIPDVEQDLLDRLVGRGVGRPTDHVRIVAVDRRGLERDAPLAPGDGRRSSPAASRSAA
jgi:hypothetical protein